MDNKTIQSMINKCEIFYDDLLISAEEIIKKYMTFFANELDEGQKSVGFAFHTGSLCFDVAAISALMFACIAYNLSNNDEILCTLEIGDMVLFEGERYRWNGITTGMDGQNSTTEYMCITQDGKGKNGIRKRFMPYQRNKHKIRPYFGNSKLTDGRGIRKTNNNRNEFLEYVLNVPEYEVPSNLDISVVVIADKGEFIDICQHLNISYKNKKKVYLTDIIPVSYFTGTGEEIQIGKNPSKAEAVIKSTSKISVARDLILDKSGNKVIGLVALNVDSLVTNASGFKDLIRRKTLQFAIVAAPYNVESGNLAVEQYEDAAIFACTKEIISTISHAVKSPNKLTYELNQQIGNVGRDIDIIYMNGGWTWLEYQNLKNGLCRIRQSNWEDKEKEEFIICSLGLINLFTSAFFSMQELEQAIDKGWINMSVISPALRIERLRQLSESSLSAKESCETVILSLERMYENLYVSNPKGIWLRQLIHKKSNIRITFIVAKAYYMDLFRHFFAENIGNNIVCCTANRFDAGKQYDRIVVLGDITGKRFNPLQCYAAMKIEMLLYDCEEKTFQYKKKMSDQYERKLNVKIKGGKGIKDDNEMNDEKILENNDAESMREFAKLDELVNKIEMFDINKITVMESCANNNTGLAEVNYIGVFSTGEKVLFSKYYSAVVYDRIEQKVVESSPIKLVPGDELVFTKRNDYTSNIVDMIFNQLLHNNQLSQEVQVAAGRANRWKRVLNEFKKKKGLSYREVANALKKLGSTLQEGTIRQWLNSDSHIIGPRTEETMFLIAKLTKDSDMLSNSKVYFEACRAVRHYRREILNLIAQAINDKLSNIIPEKGSVFEVVYEHIDNLSEIMELESIYELNQTAVVSCNIVNRPIEEKEVML